jgi:MFS family permease
MANRWLILAILTFSRTVMGFQFQTVAAVSASLTADLHYSFATIGTLVGLYLLPGVAIALPGGLIGQYFGDKRVACAGLLAMTLGSTAMALSDNTGLLTMGRIMSGCGAVFFNILVAKMVTDWFQEKEIVTALGVLVTSWPLGIALALVSIPPLVAFTSWQIGMWSAAALSCIALLGVVIVYQPPAGAAKRTAGWRIQLVRHEFVLATLSGLVWAFFNMGLIVLLTFGPAWLIVGGTGSTAASALVSIVSWVAIPAITLGALIAERIRRPDWTMLGCLLLEAACILSLPLAGASIPLLAVIGVFFGPPAGLIMALPAEAAPQERRAVVMGVYYTWYYVGMGVIPAFAGFVRDVSGSATAPIYLGGTMFILSASAAVLFRFVQLRSRLPHSIA